MKIGCRAHDYGKHPAQELALILHNAGYQAAQVAVPKAIEGINDYQHISPEQLETLRSGFAAHDVEISVLGCYQDLSDPDAVKLPICIWMQRNALHGANGCSTVFSAS